MKKIIVEYLVSSQKTAILEDDKLIELLIEDNKNSKKVSNIYRGVVKKVILGIQACFVDIGFEKLAYLQLDKDSNIKAGQDILVQVTRKEEPSILSRYLIDLAKAFSSFYNENKIIVEDKDIQNARVYLTYAVNQVLKNGVELLGMQMPNKM